MAAKNTWPDLRVLADPLPASAIEWRVQSHGMTKAGKPWAKVLAYLTSRAVMDRLDEVVGPENWWNEYREGPGGGIICGITIRTEHGPVTKWDGAENTQVEAIKGGLSSAMKRSAVHWGIGRILYGLGESWADIGKGDSSFKGKDGKFYNWTPPALPAWALPKGDKSKPIAQSAEPEDSPAPKVASKKKDAPKTGVPVSTVKEIGEYAAERLVGGREHAVEIYKLIVRWWASVSTDSEEFANAFGACVNASIDGLTDEEIKRAIDGKPIDEVPKLLEAATDAKVNKK